MCMCVCIGMYVKNDQSGSLLILPHVRLCRFHGRSKRVCIFILGCMHTHVYLITHTQHVFSQQEFKRGSDFMVSPEEG
jgi:hypothetical protein